MKLLALIRVGSQFNRMALTCQAAPGTCSPLHNEEAAVANGRVPLPTPNIPHDRFWKMKSQ